MMRSSTSAQSVWKKIAIPTSDWKQSIFRNLGTYCQSLSESHPRAYISLAAIFGILGFSYLLLFPCLAVISVHSLYEALITNQHTVWNHVFVWLVLSAITILVSYRIYCYRPTLPSGFVLNKGAAPWLNQLVEHQLGHYSSTKIDRIMLSNKFEIDIVKTPKRGLPLRSLSTLVIGLPLIHCLSASQFQCALARRLGQFSKRYNLLGNWLYQLREIWPQYCDSARKYDFGYHLVGWFFIVYAPVYKVITMPAARLDELAADKYAMELFNDEDVLDTITTQLMCEKYLAGKSWLISTKTADCLEKNFKKFRLCMVSELRRGLHGDKSSKWLADILSVDEQWDDATPTLASRVENIGHTHFRMVTNVTDSAASVYLGATIYNLPENSEDSHGQEKSALQG
jgi:hypothetical protein